MHQADSDGLDVLVTQLGHQPGDRVGIWSAAQRAVGVDPFVDFEAQVARHQRCRHLEEQVIQLVAVLAGDLVRVAEASGGQESRARALAFDDGVGHQGGAVDDVLDLIGRCAGLLQRIPEHVGDRLRRVAGRGQNFAHGERAAAVIDQDQIGEGAADVDADSVPPLPLGEGWGEGGVIGAHAEALAAPPR